MKNYGQGSNPRYVLNGAKMWITNGTIDGQETGDAYLVGPLGPCFGLTRVTGGGYLEDSSSPLSGYNNHDGDRKSPKDRVVGPRLQMAKI